MTLCGCLWGSWAIGSALRLWPGLLVRLGWSAPAATAAALALLAATALSAPVARSALAAVALALGLAAFARVAVGARGRCLEAAMLSALVLLLGRAVSPEGSSLLIAGAAGAAAAVLATGERASVAAALLGLGGLPALSRAPAATAAGADDLAVGVTVAVSFAAVGRAVARRRQVEGGSGL